MKNFETLFRKISKILSIILFVIGIISLFILVPTIQNLILLAGEKLLNRALNHGIWLKRFYKWEIKFLLIDFFLSVLFIWLSHTKYIVFYSTSDTHFHIRSEIINLLESRKQLTSISIVFIVLIGVRFFLISQKKSMHIDEALSISICNRNEYGFWGKMYNLNEEYTGKELKQISLWDNSTLKDSLSDIFHMHKYNRDTPHTNFYYSFYRLWFTGTKSTDLNYILWRGCLLNVCFFIISFIFMFLLLRRFTDNITIISIDLLIAFLNPASLSLTIFMRPYELQQTFVIILCYYVTCILQSESEEKNVETKKILIIGIIVLALTMLAAYFNCILIGFHGLYIILLCIKKKNWNLLKFFILMFIGSLVLAKLLYFDFGNMDYRGKEASENLDLSNVINNLKAVRRGIFDILNKNIFFMFYCLTFVFLNIFLSIRTKNNKETRIISIVLVINLISLVTIFYFAPIDMKYLRYVAPIFPIFALSFIKIFKNKKLNLFFSSTILFILFFTLIPWNNKSALEHIDDSEIENYKEIKETKLPIFVEGKIVYQYGCLIPYLNDNSRVIFISDYSEIKEKYSHCIPCIFIAQVENDEEYNFNSDELNVSKLCSIKYHKVYKINNTGR